MTLVSHRNNNLARPVLSIRLKGQIHQIKSILSDFDEHSVHSDRPRCTLPPHWPWSFSLEPQLGLETLASQGISSVPVSFVFVIAHIAMTTILWLPCLVEKHYWSLRTNSPNVWNPQCSTLFPNPTLQVIALDWSLIEIPSLKESRVGEEPSQMPQPSTCFLWTRPHKIKSSSKGIFSFLRLFVFIYVWFQVLLFQEWFGLPYWTD